MLEPTGSVYLDAPRKSRTQPNPSHRGRLVSAAVLGFIAITSMMLAGFFAGVHYLVAEPGPTLDAIDAAIDSPIAREELHDQISKAVSGRLVGSEISGVAAIYGVDVAAESNRVADKILDDPAFRSALDDFVTSVHRIALIDPNGPPIEFTPVTEAALAVLRRDAPELAELVTPGAQIIAFDTTSIPDLSAPMRLVDRALLAALVGMLGLPLAAVVHPRRHRVLAWTGRSWVLAGIVGAGFAIGLPYLGGAITGWSTVEIALRAAVHRLVIPSAVLAITGGILMTLAAVLKRRQQNSTSVEGADAALGMFQVPSLLPSHQLDDSGNPALLDAGRPLTSM